MMDSGLGGTPSVGAVIVNWNSWEYLQQCLEAIAGQELPFTRVVVVDNGSVPPVKPWTASSLQGLTYIKLDQNHGFARANNIALDYLTDCDWVALVNPDAFLQPTWLKLLMDAVRRYPAVPVFAGCLVKAEQPDRLDGAGDVLHISGIAWRRGHGSLCKSHTLMEGEVFGPCAAAALYRREVLMQVGGFDDDFFCYFEDVDLAFRLRLRGCECRLVPTAIARHVGSAASGGPKSDFAVYHGHRNLVWCYVKNMPGLLFWLLMPLFVLMNAIVVVRFVLRGQGRTILRAKRDALKGIAGMWHKRLGIQRQRTVSVNAIWRRLDKRLRLRLNETPHGKPSAGK